MNSPTSKTHRMISRLGIATLACCYSFLSGIAVAGNLNIANNALEVATGVKPNIIILNDDSGTMDLSILISGTDQGRYFITNNIRTRSYNYVQNDPENSASRVLPSQVALDARAAFWTDNNYVAEEWQGVWRARNSSFNTVYYNPETRYTPWKGVNDSGLTFTDMPPTAALVDPYVTTSDTFNLTVNNTFQSFMPHETDVSLAYLINETIYPASYYTWKDTDLDGVVDHDDEHSLIEIRTSAASITASINRTDCVADPGNCTPAEELQNYANFYSYYRRRELLTKGAITNVLDPVTSVRVGMTAINNNANNRTPVASLNISPASGAKKDLFDKIFLTQSSGETPLRQNLASVGEYFSCNTSIFGTGTGAPGTGCPVEASPAGECQQNYTILMTDGFWNGDPPTVGNTDGGTSSSDFDSASFADAFSNTLADVAMHYYENDIQSTLDNDVPTTTLDGTRYNGAIDPFETMHQHMSTYTVGLGVAGTLPSNPDNTTDNPASFAGGTITGWPDPTGGSAEKTDDLRHAAWNGRGDFLSASNTSDLTQSLQSIFDEIQSGTGTASAVAFNTQNLDSGALVFRAFFDTNLNTGSLIAQDVSITGVISDVIRWDAAIELDALTFASTDTRNIVTYDAVAKQGVPFSWDTTNGINTSQRDLLKLPTITANPPTPDELGENRLNYLRGHSENEGPNVNAGEFRTRPTDEGKLGDMVHSAPVFVGTPPFQLRDNAPFPDTTGNLYSEFVSSHKTREEIVYIGANDGMLHGFAAFDGKEKFAYVPNIIFPDLTKLTDPDYNHQYYVDLSMAINDVYIQPTTGTNAGTLSWNTVLVGGLGAAAPGYFALNITDPDDLDTEASTADNVMWEFTQADDTGSPDVADDRNLGRPISPPLVALSNIVDADGKNRWVVIFGNGYNSDSTNGDAELYIAFIDGGLNGSWTQGVDYFKITTGVGKAESGGTNDTPNSLGGIRGIDIDTNGTVDVVYAGDYQGNVYRFNLTETSISNTLNTTNKPVQTLFTATYDSSTGPIQPITNRPVVIEHPTQNGYIIILGTGSYFTTDDITNQDIQSIYGLWDDFTAGSDTINVVEYDRLEEQTLSNATSVSGFTTRTLTNNLFSWGHVNETSGSAASRIRREGWVINLDVPDGASVEFPGERAVRNFLIRGGIAFVNSVIPRSTNACTAGPGGFEYSFNPETGGSGVVPVFDLNNDGVFDENDNIGGDEGTNGSTVVSGTRFDKSTPTDSSFIGNRKVTQTSDQGIRSTGTNTGNDNPNGRNSWREIEL